MNRLNYMVFEKCPGDEVHYGMQFLALYLVPVRDNLYYFIIQNALTCFVKWSK
jgi:hypothetical protein